MYWMLEVLKMNRLLKDKFGAKLLSLWWFFVLAGASSSGPGRPWSGGGGGSRSPLHNQDFP